MLVVINQRMETDNDAISGSALLLGRCVLHTRLPRVHIRSALDHLQAAPLGAAKVRMVPVFISGTPMHMIFLRCAVQWC